jgi:guanylate kinase
MSGKLIIFSAPSGSGKTTIVKHLINTDLNLEFSVSATSRGIRGDEINGKDYYFFSADKFRKLIEDEEFIEWEEVYKDHFYGTLKSEIERIWNKGNHVIFDVDVIGGINLKHLFKEKALSVFVMPPSLIELKERLKLRATDSSEKIEMRLEKANEEILKANEFDLTIVNNDLGIACNKASYAVKTFLEDNN